MMREHDYARRHQRWLEGFGFRKGDPFEVWDAEQEGDALSALFVDRPYLRQVIGNPASPQSAFLLAGRGAGKTATREMVVYECFFGAIHHRALPVRYSDFSYTLGLANDNPQAVTAEHHVQAIARATLRAAAEDTPATFFDFLEGEERTLLSAYAARFADPVIQFKLARRLQGAHADLPLDGMSAVELLTQLAQLVARLGSSQDHGYEALYVLVDKVDESAAGAAAAISLLRPLVEEGALMVMPPVAFKFFLPVEVGERLREVVEVRTDKVPFLTITWDATDLSRMLDQRLSHFSDGLVDKFGQICSADARFARERLVQASESSPRRLLRLCAALVRHHVVRTTDMYVESRDVTAALHELDHIEEATQHRAAGTLTPGTPMTASTEPPDRGLFLDKGGHVWVDGEALTGALSGLEFRLLTALYRASPNIVPQEKLVAAVWLAEQPVGGDWRNQDAQNLRKLITRLRQRLEPDAREGAWRFIRNARGRGYWLSRD